MISHTIWCQVLLTEVSGDVAGELCAEEHSARLVGGGIGREVTVLETRKTVKQ